MINIPMTDILTPMTGEVEKPTTIDHSETAVVSFQSVVVAKDIGMDAMVAVPSQPLAPQPYPSPKIDYVGLEVAFSAFITKPDSVPDPVALAQGDQPPALNQFATTDNMLTAPVMALGGRAGDTDKMATATTFVPKGVQHNEQSAISKPSAEGSVIGMEGTANARQSTATELLPYGGNLAGQPVINMPVTAQLKHMDPVTQVSADSAVPVRNNAQMAVPTIAVPPETASSKIPADPTEASLPIAASPKARVTVLEKSSLVQKTPFAPQTQSRPIESSIVESQPVATTSVGDRAIESKPAPAPIQTVAPRPTQMPAVDQPLNQAVPAANQTVPAAPAVTQRPAFKADAMEPDLVRKSTLQPQQIQPDTTPKSTIPQKETQAPAQGHQSQINQPRVQQVVIATTPATPSGVTPQATLSPMVERPTGKPTPTPTAVPPTRVQSKNSSTQTATVPDAGPTMPLTETTTAGALDPVSVPELAPFDVKSTDSLTNLRHDVNINRPEVMRHVAQQLADVARKMPDRPVELALNPEELGRVRLTFTTTDGGIHIAVMAERGETMDLLRRHIETLAQEFREMGYKDVNFEFSQNGQNDAQNGDADAQNRTEPDAAHTQAPPLAPIQLSLEPSVGLDLRL